ncbi:LOW QUALITY PROTEIN: sulfotransferase 6B1-like [Ara ararauna]
MNRNRERIIKIVDNSSSQNEKIPPESILFAIEVFYTSTLTSPETLEALKSFETWSDNMILAGYPKTAEENQVFLPLYALPLLQLPRMKKLPSRRIIQIHLPPYLLPTSMLQSKAKILVLLPNSKDIAVSYYHFYNNMPVLPSFASWDEYFAAFMKRKLTWGFYFDHLVEWNKCTDRNSIMMVSYKEHKEDQVLGMKKISAFFGFSLCEEDFHRIAKKTSFQAMKEIKEMHGKSGNILFQKGVVGNWRDLFSKAQNEEMDQKFEDSLGGTKLAARMKYGMYWFENEQMSCMTASHGPKMILQRWNVPMFPFHEKREKTLRNLPWTSKYLGCNS